MGRSALLKDIVVGRADIEVIGEQKVTHGMTGFVNKPAKNSIWVAIDPLKMVARDVA